jgi:hypothetical protein
MFVPPPCTIRNVKEKTGCGDMWAMYSRFIQMMPKLSQLSHAYSANHKGTID